MTVQELIDRLNKVEDKSLSVVIITPDGFLDVEDNNFCDWANVIVLSSK